MLWTANWQAERRFMYLFLTTPKHFSLTQEPTKKPHQFLCLDYVTHWPHDTKCAQRPPTQWPQKASSRPLFWKNLSTSSCSLSGNDTSCWQEGIPESEYSRIVCDFFFYGGLVRERELGVPHFFYFFFQDWFPWMTLMMSVVCLGCWWSEGEGREGGMEGWRGGERSEK